MLSVLAPGHWPVITQYIIVSDVAEESYSFHGCLVIERMSRKFWGQVPWHTRSYLLIAMPLYWTHELPYCQQMGLKPLPHEAFWETLCTQTTSLSKSHKSSQRVIIFPHRLNKLFYIFILLVKSFGLLLARQHGRQQSPNVNGWNEGRIFYLFTFQTLSPFPVSPPEIPYANPPLLHLWGCSLTNLPTPPPTSPPWYSPILEI